MRVLSSSSPRLPAAHNVARCENLGVCREPVIVLADKTAPVYAGVTDNLCSRDEGARRGPFIVTRKTAMYHVELTVYTSLASSRVLFAVVYRAEFQARR